MAGGRPSAMYCRGAASDEAAASMLAQLLGSVGLALVLPYGAVSRTNIASLDVRGAAMMCVSYLDISGNPAHLRYLLSQFASALPTPYFSVGLWPQGEAVLHDRDLRRLIGAQYYVTTLREAVEACLSAAHEAVRPKPRLVTAAEEAFSTNSFRDIAHPIWAICSIALAISSDVHAKYKCQCFPQFKNVSAGVGQRGC